MNLVNPIPPFVQIVSSALSWKDIAKAFLPEATHAPARRFPRSESVPTDAAMCALYDALYNSRRALFIDAIADEFYLNMRTRSIEGCVVDAGCGPGHVVLGLAKRAAADGRNIRFVGYDPSPEMIHIAEGHRRNCGLDNVEFICGDSEEDACSAVLTTASVLFVRNVLSWVRDPDSQLKQWRELLPTGAVLISREVRRDIPLEQFKARMVESCWFRIATQELYYPPKEYVLAFFSALTKREHRELISRHFGHIQAARPRSALEADDGAGDAAESQLRVVNQ